MQHRNGGNSGPPGPISDAVSHNPSLMTAPDMLAMMLA